MSRSFGGMRLTTFAPMVTSPCVISSSPAIMRSNVDLPQPEGPTRTLNSPSAMATSTPRMTWVEPNHFWTPAIFTAAMAFLLALYAMFRCAGTLRTEWHFWFRRLRAAGAPGHDVIGSSRRKPGDDVLCSLAPQLLFRLHGVKRRMRL